MSVSIITCPSCDAMLLDDTVQCPGCQHVLRPDEHAAKGFDRLDAAQVPTVAVGESRCPACNESVRHGLVRCWNCGTFMNQQVQQSFLRQVAGGAHDGGPHQDSEETSSNDYSDAGHHYEGRSGEQPTPLAPDDSEDDVAFADDEDFEISPEYSMRAPSDHLKSYRVAWNDTSDAPAATDHVQPGDDGVYRLAGDASTPVVSPVAPSASIVPSAPAAAPSAAPQPSAPQPPAANPPGAKQTGAPASAAAAPIPLLDGGESHSVATAGDVLLQIALEEEQQQTARKNRPARRKTAGTRAAGPRTADGVMVFCPNGHRIEVRAKHRGLMGRCPKCRMPFFVPVPSPDEAAAPQSTALDMSAPAAAPAAPGAAASSVQTVGGAGWMADVALHVVNLAKVKAKPGCLAKAFQPVDVVFLPEGLNFITLVKPGGLFGGAKKADAARQAAQTHLAEGKPLAELPAAARFDVSADALPQVKIVQPAAYAHESPFGDVPVFGDGRVALQLPTHPDAPERKFLSFPLSRFRDLVRILRSQYRLDSFAETAGVPLTDSFTEQVCHFSEAKFNALADAAWYKADPAFTLEIVGRQCEGCGIIVGEDARKKEKIGSLDGKGVAKAKCPKCGKKFGDIPFYQFGTPQAPAK